MTRTYYRGPDAIVTSERFVWRPADPKIFPVRELREIARIRVRRPLLRAWLTGHRRATRWELHATIGTERTIIFSTSDLRVLNQVARALNRAVEVSRPSSGNET